MEDEKGRGLAETDRINSLDDGKSRRLNRYGRRSRCFKVADVGDNRWDLSMGEVSF